MFDDQTATKLRPLMFDSPSQRARMRALLWPFAARRLSHSYTQILFPPVHVTIFSCERICAQIRFCEGKTACAVSAALGHEIFVSHC